MSWVTVSSGASGSGNGSVQLQVSANSGEARTGAVTIAGQTFTVRQAGVTAPAPPACTYSLGAIVQNMPAIAGAGTVAVQAGAGCSWTAVSNVSWVTVTAGAAGVGDGPVTFAVGANSDAAPRIGTLTIANHAFTVAQAATGPACAYTINPTSRDFTASGGSGTIAVSTSANCAWTATGGDSWVTIGSGGSGSGNGTVNFTVAANGGAARETRVTIAGQAFTITQAAAAVVCSYSINPTSRSFAAAGGSGTISVSAPNNCGWSAVSDEQWVTVGGGGSGERQRNGELQRRGQHRRRARCERDGWRPGVHDHASSGRRGLLVFDQSDEPLVRRRRWIGNNCRCRRQTAVVGTRPATSRG